MTTKAPFLNMPYGGYFHNEVPAEDAELTHVGPGTPGGEWFRRFWQPVALSEDLKDLLPEGHWRIGYDKTLLGASLAGQGKFAEAEPQLLDGYSQMKNDPEVSEERMQEATRPLHPRRTR